MKSVHGLQQAANGEKMAYNTAAKIARGQARQMRRRSQINDQSHPQLAAIIAAMKAQKDDVHSKIGLTFKRQRIPKVSILCNRHTQL